MNDSGRAQISHLDESDVVHTPITLWLLRAANSVMDDHEHYGTGTPHQRIRLVAVIDT